MLLICTIHMIGRAMSTETKTPWRCRWCKRLCKMSAMCCPECGSTWQSAMDPTYAHGGGARETSPRKRSTWQPYDWQPASSWNDWVGWPERSGTQSPRKKSPRRKGKGGDAHGGKGAGGKVPAGAPLSQWQLPAMQPLAPFSSGSADTQTSLGQNAPPPSKESEEMQKYRALARTLRTSTQSMPEEVMAALAALETTNSKEETKTYHQLVTSMGQCKKDLASLQANWKNYRTSWVKYCQEMLHLWEKHTAAYEEGEKNFVAQQAEAKQRLEEVKSKLGALHQQATAEEREEMNVDVDEEEPATTAATANIKKMRDAMNAAMTTLKDSVEEASPRRKVSMGSQDNSALPPAPTEPFH